MNVVVNVVSRAHERTRLVSSMFTVSADPMWMNVVPATVVAVGDFAPRSVSTGCASILKESLGTPGTAFTGTRISVARTTSTLSRRAAGIATRSKVRAEGAPPTVRLASSPGFGGSNTKLSNRFGTVLSWWATESGVADVVSGIV